MSSDNTLTFSMHNHIKHVELNAAESTAAVRAATIIDVYEVSKVFRWPVQYDGAGDAIDELFLRLKGVMGPFSDLLNANGTLLETLQFCQQLPGLTNHQKNHLAIVKRLHDAAGDLLHRAASISPFESNAWKKHMKRHHINEGKATINTVANSLKEHLTSGKAPFVDMVTADQRNRHIMLCNKTVLFWGLFDQMFDAELFV